MEPDAREETKAPGLPGPAVLSHSSSFDDETPRSLEIEESKQPAAADPSDDDGAVARSSGGAASGQGSTQLAQTLGLGGEMVRTADLINAERLEMRCPRDMGGFVRPSATLHAWGPFLIFCWATLASWVATFAIGASWQEFLHRYYFSFAFTVSLVVQGWQGVHLAELLEGSATAVSMQCTGHLRTVLGLFAGLFGLVPAVLAYNTLRHGVDNNAFSVNYYKLSFRGFAGNTMPLCGLFMLVGVHEAWLDYSDPRYSVVLTVAVISTIIAAGATVFSWEASSRNRRSTEIFFDAVFSIYGALTIASESLRFGLLLGWVSLLPCVGRAAITLPVACLAVGGYYAYVRAACRVDVWSPQFALLWACINSFLLGLVIAVFFFLWDEDERRALVPVSPASQTGADDDPVNYWRGGHCFDGKVLVQQLGVLGGLASLCVTLLALVVDPQVGVDCCRRKSCFASDRYDSLFVRSDSLSGAVHYPNRPKQSRSSDLEQSVSADYESEQAVEQE